MTCSGEKIGSGQELLGSLRNTRASPWVIVWGLESSIDYRVTLPSSESASHRLWCNHSDDESEVSQGFFSRAVSSIQHELGRTPSVDPGGSPLLSAIAANQLRGWNPDLAIPESVFWGLYSPTLRVLPREANWSHLLRYAIEEPRIVGSLCLECPEHSVRQVLSVFRGRVLNSHVSKRLAARLCRILADYGDSSVLLGIGGVNKSPPRELKAQVSTFRSSATATRIVLITTNSFSPILRRKNSDMLMKEYLDLLGLADIVSMSADELCQLAQWSGLPRSRGGLYPLLRDLKLPNLTIVHHRCGSAISTGRHFATAEARSMLKGVLDLATRGMLQYCQHGITQLDRLSEGLSKEQQRLADGEFEGVFGLSSSDQCAAPSPYTVSNGSVHSTGLGARFDGYLSVLFAMVWQWLVKK